MHSNKSDHEFLWNVLEGALGAEKTAYLRHSPLDEIVLNKMAQDYPDQEMPARILLPEAAAHIAEKHAYAKRSWQMIEAGIESIRQLREQGLYKRASLLPRGSLQRKLAVRQRLVMAALDGGETQEKVAALLPEYDRQLQQYLGQERFEKVAASGMLSRIGEGAKKTYEAVASNPTGRSALQGLGFGTAAAIPATGVGYHMMNRAEDKAKGMMLPMAAAGAGGAILGGIGTGLGEALGERALER